VTNDAMTNDEDDVRAAGYDPDEMRDWMTAGAGAELAGRPDMGNAPVELLPAPGTPVSVMRNLRLPYETDEALKATANARGITVSELIREAINALLAGELDSTPDPVVALRLTLAAASRAVDRLTTEHPEAA
jgi:ribbon-helix-helix CopG family protein